MRIALDANRYVDFAKGVPEVAAHVAKADAVFLPFVVLGELRSGFLGGSRGEHNERGLIHFLSSPRVAVLHADDGTTHHYARLTLQLRKQGAPIPTNDVWIAALVVQHNLHLLARDQHFDALPQLAML